MSILFCILSRCARVLCLGFGREKDSNGVGSYFTKAKGKEQ